MVCGGGIGQGREPRCLFLWRWSGWLHSLAFRTLSCQSGMSCPSSCISKGGSWVSFLGFLSPAWYLTCSVSLLLEIFVRQFDSWRLREREHEREIQAGGSIFGKRTLRISLDFARLQKLFSPSGSPQITFSFTPVTRRLSMYNDFKREGIEASDLA